jgi:hypothetical protein
LPPNKAKFSEMLQKMYQGNRVLRFGPGLFVLLTGICLGQEATGPVLIPASHYDVSPPLRDLATKDASAPDADAQALQPDSAASPSGDAGATILLNRPGIPDNGAFLYPDSNGAVGTNQFVQWANARYSVRNKATGAVLLPATPATNLWSGFGGPCETTTAGDGIVLYDRIAKRWVITHHSGGSLPIFQCFAVSTTSDATGAYFRYSFQLTQQFPDYAKLGVWPDAYYVTANLLNPSTFASIDAQVCALDRTHMLAGTAPLAAQCWQTGTPTLNNVLLPADLDGATLPPAGAPTYLLGLNTNSLDSLDLFKLKVNWADPTKSVFLGPVDIPVVPFTEGCHGGVCVPQKGTGQKLDGVGDRPMYRLAYRNFGSHESLVVNHSVYNRTNSFVGIRWYEIRKLRTTPVIYQSGTYMPDSNFRWMGSIAMDKMGNIMLGYNVSSSTIYPSIRYTGRLVTDPLGKLQPEKTIINGNGFKTDFHWGAYSSMALDPVDDCTFWFTGEYMDSSGRAWSTRIAAIKFPSCR